VEAGTDRDGSLRAALVLAGTALVLYVADQATKALIVMALEPGESVDVLGELVRIWYVRNTGAAFSLFPGAIWLFIPVTVVALVMIGYFFRAFRDRGPLLIHVVLGTILAGTLGNLTDRLRLGYVVDFISVGIGDLRFPTFNVADSAVVVGIGLLVAYLTFADARRRQDEPAA
jgi:signal peptidase II